jgi:hypothetical protein
MLTARHGNEYQDCLTSRAIAADAFEAVVRALRAGESPPHERLLIGLRCSATPAPQPSPL